MPFLSDIYGGIGDYLDPEQSDPGTVRRALGNLVSNARELTGTDAATLAHNQELQAAANKKFDYTMGRNQEQYISPDELADLTAKEQEYATNIGLLSPVLGMMKKVAPAMYGAISPQNISAIKKAKQEGYFLHGRSPEVPFGDYMVQSTTDPQVAIFYGNKGMVHAWKPNQKTNVLHLDDKKTNEILSDLEGTDFEHYGHSDISPKNLVNSAGAWDDPNFISWFFDHSPKDYWKTDAVIIPQKDESTAAILFNKNNVDYYKSKGNN